MAAFALTGTSTPLGQRVVAALGGEAAVLDLAADPGASLDGAGCLVSLAVGPCPSPEPGGAALRLAALRRALDTADDAGVSRVVHLSSALVYGVSEDNAVPLADDAPVRPDARSGWAVELAEAERLVAEWHDRATGRTAAVLRPSVVVAPFAEGGPTRPGRSAPRPAGGRRPIQFVHVDDVAAAVVLCATAAEPVDGPLNVAPDGGVADDEAAVLAGAPLLPPSVLAPLVGPIRRLAQAVGAAPSATEADAAHPWLVAADRLRSLGWTPTRSAEDAVVDATACSRLADLSPSRRQALLLAVAASLAGTVVLTVLMATARAIRGSGR